MNNIDIDTKLRYEEPIFSQYNTLKYLLEKTLQEATSFNRKMIVRHI